MWRLVIASLLFSISASAKERSPIARKAALDAAFVLKQSESAVVANKIEIRFLKVTEDSRCPSDVQCGMAGRAIGLFAMSRKGAAPTNIQIDANPHNAPTMYLNYEIKFTGLTPSPLSTKRIPQNEYAATLLVSRAK